jgi:hypothetical protein
MAHFAEVDENNIVLRVLVVPNDQEHRGQEYLANDVGLGGTWLKTSYNTYGGVHYGGGIPFRKNFAGIGCKYDQEKDAFIPTSPGPEWILNDETCLWGNPNEISEDIIE